MVYIYTWGSESLPKCSQTILRLRVRPWYGKYAPKRKVRPFKILTIYEILLIECVDECQLFYRVFSNVFCLGSARPLCHTDHRAHLPAAGHDPSECAELRCIGPEDF